MIDVNLSMKEFTKYFEQNRLGKFYFPNGELYGKKLWINLRDLYKLVTCWRIKDTEIPLDDIVAIISFGSAVRYPDLEEFIHKKKKYLLFGPEIPLKKQRRIFPEDVDFYVLTGKDLTKDKSIPTNILTDD